METTKQHTVHSYCLIKSTAESPKRLFLCVGDLKIVSQSTVAGGVHHRGSRQVYVYIYL